MGRGKVGGHSGNRYCYFASLRTSKSTTDASLQIYYTTKRMLETMDVTALLVNIEGAAAKPSMSRKSKAVCKSTVGPSC